MTPADALRLVAQMADDDEIHPEGLLTLGLALGILDPPDDDLATGHADELVADYAEDIAAALRALAAEVER